MENKNEKLTKMVLKFHCLEDDEKIEVAKRIEQAWGRAYVEYVDLCKQDAELCELYDKLSKIRSIMSFDLADEYYVYTDSYNAFDEDYAQENYEFSPELLAEAKYISEHLEEINAPLKQRLDELNKKLEAEKAELENIQKNGGLFKRIAAAALKSRIEKLEREIFSLKDDISDNEFTAKKYKENMQKQEAKEYYQNNYEKLVAPLQELFDSQSKILAEKVIDKYIETDPIIICVEHNGKKTMGGERVFCSEALNEVCNEKRNNILELNKDQGFEQV